MQMSRTSLLLLLTLVAVSALEDEDRSDTLLLLRHEGSSTKIYEDKASDGDDQVSVDAFPRTTTSTRDLDTDHNVHNLTVKNTGRTNETEPEFSVIIPNITIPVGRDLQLTCIVNNLGPYKVAWLKARTKRILTIDRHIITEDPRVSLTIRNSREFVLSIRKVKESDLGGYMCQINTFPLKSQIGYVDVQSPSFHFPLEEQRDRLKEANVESLHFRNQPLPMTAVVPLNATPETVVYKLEAKFLDTDINIHYFIVRDTTGGRFYVDERSGEVRTLGTEPFMLDKVYVLYVKAEDHDIIKDGQYRSTEEEAVSIIGGRRPPQFYRPYYEANIPESLEKGAYILEVKAKAFTDSEIRYRLRTQGRGVGTFSMDPVTGVMKLEKDLDVDDPLQQKFYALIVTAYENNGSLSTSVEIIVKILDVNDNAPRFKLLDYQAYVDEDVEVGTFILRVSANDSDQYDNAKIEYSLDTEYFTIDNKGIIYSNRRLDADVRNNYVLTVKATDKGDPPLTGTATVRIYTENKNDEPPKFSQDSYESLVDENAGPNTLVTTVEASDIDGDNIYFGLEGGRTVHNMFQIDERTGVIRLINGIIQLEEDYYKFYVTARDDGVCCKNGNLTTHTSTARVVVLVSKRHVDDNRPFFEECSTYAPQVNEKTPRGTQILKVKAFTKNSCPNDEVRYSLFQYPSQKEINFIIDEITGVIKTNKAFDRKENDVDSLNVTVIATCGATFLKRLCSFKVGITDNSLLDREEYADKNETKYIRIGIDGKTDDQPYFDQDIHEAKINKDVDIQHTAIKAVANEKDE